jgi:hypothetical protein
MSATRSSDSEWSTASPDGPDCMQVYLRHDRAARLHSAVADVASVDASSHLKTAAGAYVPENVVDRQVFETCLDRWLARPGAAARLDITLVHPEQIACVALLNTRGQWRPARRETAYPSVYGNVAAYHAARTIDVKMMDGQTVIAARRIEADGYPYWTTVRFDPALRAATKIRLEFPDWRGAGPGLNEIVAYRAHKTEMVDSARASATDPCRQR